MPILLWIIHCTQILRAFSIILTIVTVWQFRGYARIKLIHGYGFAVICVMDSASEICEQLNIPSNKCRNNPRNVTILPYIYIYVRVCVCICFSAISLADVACSLMYVCFVLPLLWVALCKILTRNEIFLGATSCRRDESARSVSRFRRMAWRKCSSLQPHGGEKMWAESSFFWPWQRGPFALIWMGIAAMSLALPLLFRTPPPRSTFPSSWTTHHFSLFVIPRSLSYFPQLPPLISGSCRRSWRFHLVLSQITYKRRPPICCNGKQPRLSRKALEN